MKPHRLLFVPAILAAALFAITLISDDSSAISLTDKYVGNKMVDFEWTRYGGDDFDRYELWRDGEEVETIYDQDELFTRDEGLFTDEDYSYEIKVINA